MDKPKQRIGRIFPAFAGICIIGLPFLVFLAFSTEPKENLSEPIEIKANDFDQKGITIFENYNQTSQDYLLGTSTERTLDMYYSLRQYSGSPPYIPHNIDKGDETSDTCLTCHAKGGWAQKFKRNTPVTPHPELVACRQCHVKLTWDKLFVSNKWMSTSPPPLGRSHLPGAPPPIPHSLQMRENCIACHVGPGAVTAIRVDHASRGNCRQCHIPDSASPPFKREPEPS